MTMKVSRNVGLASFVLDPTLQSGGSSHRSPLISNYVALHGLFAKPIESSIDLSFPDPKIENGLEPKLKLQFPGDGYPDCALNRSRPLSVSNLPQGPKAVKWPLYEVMKERLCREKGVEDENDDLAFLEHFLMFNILLASMKTGLP
ncbi:hypothetical protein COLO4_33494 [Corchorus olitorius]|uniref:Uncharacterized protein n=1 Tax=Corchorus olitorius TaxID=93759 RepID=A0A1R3GT77_9ROSI|nr:hypothetical protein COLO4_33494 [Corchorus olitorius]